MTGKAIIWVTAPSKNTANQRINECLRYAIHNIDGFNRFKKTTVNTAKERLDDLTTRLSIPDRDTNRNLHITVVRTDGTDRKGGAPHLWLNEEINAGNVTDVIRPSGPGARADNVSSILKSGAAFHFARECISIEARTEIEDHVMHAVRVLTGTNHTSDALNQGIPHAGGRPPLGCTVEDGMLRPSDEFEHVRRVLLDVRDDQCSKRRASKKTWLRAENYY